VGVGLEEFPDAVGVEELGVEDVEQPVGDEFQLTGTVNDLSRYTSQPTGATCSSCSSNSAPR
jgi:hypothetical protein